MLHLCVAYFDKKIKLIGQDFFKILIIQFAFPRFDYEKLQSGDFSSLAETQIHDKHKFNILKWWPVTKDSKKASIVQNPCFCAQHGLQKMSKTSKLLVNSKVKNVKILIILTNKNSKTCTYVTPLLVYLD